MTGTLRMALGVLTVFAAGTLAAGPVEAQRRDAPQGRAWHDPLEDARGELDEVALAVLDAFPAYDAEGILAAVAALEERTGTEAATPLDGWIAAQGCLELLVIQRFYEREDPDGMPAVLEGVETDQLSERGLDQVRRFKLESPGHPDANRVKGELISFQIRGMTAGMTKGPKARRAIEAAREQDPANAWAEFAQARMHFHNPAFVGGDKNRALIEFRSLSRSVDHFRISLYLAHCYREKDMLAQARFWTDKALAQAPENPEIRAFSAQLEEQEEVVG